MRPSFRPSLLSSVTRSSLVLWAGAAASWGCDVIRGSGRVIEEEREISAFERIVIRGEGEVDFTQGDDLRLTIQAEDNIVAELVTKVERGSLVLATRQGVILDPTLPIEFHVEGPELTQISVDGSGNFVGDSLDTQTITIDIGGSGSVHFDHLESPTGNIDVSGSGEVTVDDWMGDELTVDIGGSGNVGLAGEAESQLVNIGGSGNYFGAKLKTDDTAVEVDGSGNVEVFAEDTLTVRIDGSGNVRFRGSPALTSFVSGSGSVSSLD